MKSFMGYRNTVIYDEAGESCIESWSIGAFVNLETGRPEKLPPEIPASMKIDPKLEMEYLMSAKYGDLLYPEIISSGGNRYIVLNNGEENLKTRALMEFCGEENHRYVYTH